MSDNACRLCDVALDVPGHDAFTYSVPPQLELAAGDGVEVSFRSRALRGVVVRRYDGPPPAFVVKPVLRRLDEVQVTPHLIELLRWGARYYRCSLGEMVAAAIPEPVRAGAAPEAQRSVAPVPGFSGALTAAQQRLLDLFVGETLSWGEALALAEGKESRLRALIERGAVTLMRSHTINEVQLSSRREQHQLSAEQAAAVAALQTPGTHLLHGVTGSGKTLVYLELAQRVIDRGQQVLWLLPEIGLTPQTAARIRSRFARTIVWHSGFTDGERGELWRRISRNEADIVVGTRSALFAPLRRIGLIVVDEEHEHTYKQESVPRYHARDLAVVYGQQLGVAVVLGSATPSLESIANVKAKRYALAQLKTRPTGGTLPTCEVVDMRSECREQKQFAVLSRALVSRLSAAKQRGEQSIVLLNRRGWSPVITCAACGEAVQCPHCAISLTWHQAAAQLRCHYCDHRQRMPAQCPGCKEPALGTHGVGTEQVETLLAAAVPGLSVLRVDADTVAGRQGHARLFQAFSQGGYDCLLGTQMVAKGLDFPKVTVVGVLAADRGLAMPDFRAAERTWQLIAQVAGRAGRGDRPGIVVVQAYDPQAEPLRAALEHRPRLFVDKELALRGEYMYPPSAALVRFLWSGRDEAKVIAAARSDAERLLSAARSEGGVLNGPNPAALARLKDLHRWSALLKASTRSAAQRVLDRVVGELPRHAGVARSVDVDPYTTS